MLMFLNFDGVLHPNAVRFAKTKNPTLNAAQHRLFESNDTLADVVADFSNLHLILNTWWTYFLGCDESLCCLPKSLSSRVSGSILQHLSSYPNLPHRVSLATEAVRTVDEPILILDHADARYPKHVLPITLLLDPQIGLADSRAARALHRFISRATERDQVLRERKVKITNTTTIMLEHRHPRKSL
jgi:hypothetical protein